MRDPGNDNARGQAGVGEEIKPGTSASVTHDLSPEELRFLIERTPKGCSKWHRVYHGKSLRLYEILVEHDGVNITVASAARARDNKGEQEASSAQIVRAVFSAFQYRHERRKAAARRAAVTRREHNEQELYRAAHAWIESSLTPRSNCRCCGRGLTDEPSIVVGLGSECRPKVVALAAAMADQLILEHDLPTTKAAIIAWVRRGLGEEAA